MCFGKQGTGLLRITNLNRSKLIHQQVKIDFDEGGIAESNVRAEIKSMMEENWKIYMEEVRQSTPLKSSSLAINHKTKAITGRKNLKKKHWQPKEE